MSKSGGVIAAPTQLSSGGSSFSINYEANSNKVATLTVSEGAHAADMALLRQYAASFAAPAGGTLIHDPLSANLTQTLTQPHRA